MKNFLIAFTVFFIWSILAIWFYSCKVKHMCYENEKESVVTASLTNNLMT